MTGHLDGARPFQETAGAVRASKPGLFTRLFSPRRSSGPALADAIRTYAVGDIHGRLDLLESILKMIAKDGENAVDRKILVFLGDYIDRGPSSKGVLDRLLQPMPEGFEVHYLKGNHEHSLLGFLADPSLYRMWRRYGAMECLQSYGVHPPLRDDDDAFVSARDALANAIPAAHLHFLNGLEMTYEIGDYFFVHAGVRPGIPLHRQSPEDMMWIREEFLESSINFGKVVIHGHSPTTTPSVRSNRIGVDTGAYVTGRLSCAVLEGSTCRFLQT
jgi:serine/threonine protein phosphatase 1